MYAAGLGLGLAPRWEPRERGSNYISSSSSNGNHNDIAANRSGMLMHGTEESLEYP